MGFLFGFWMFSHTFPLRGLELWIFGVYQSDLNVAHEASWNQTEPVFTDVSITQEPEVPAEMSPPSAARCLNPVSARVFTHTLTGDKI